MVIERTFSIIKPDATARNLTGAINALIEKAGLRIVAQKRIRMTREQAETFYAVHKARPFFGELVDFMISGPVVVQVLEGENAVLKHRAAVGCHLVAIWPAWQWTAPPPAALGHDSGGRRRRNSAHCLHRYRRDVDGAAVSQAGRRAGAGRDRRETAGARRRG